MAGPFRAVFDCNIFVQALISPDGPAGHCLRAAARGEFALVCSDHVLLEVVGVLGRPRLRRKFFISDEAVTSMVELVREIAEFEASPPAVFTYERDPDDAYYVNLAIAAGAFCIVTRDNDLLDLEREETVESMAFRDRFPSLRILVPEEFLERLARASEES